MRSFRLLEPWRSRLLWLSLGVNLFGVAFAVPRLVWHPHRSGPPGFDMVIERMARALPDGDAAAFREAMSRERPWFDLGRKRLEEARGDVAAAVGHEPFDPLAVRAALLVMQERLRDGMARFDDSLIMSLGQLSPEGRVKLADGLRRGSH